MEREREVGVAVDTALLRRRDLLLRAGVLGAAAVVSGSWVGTARANLPEALEGLLEQVGNPALRLLGHDTLAGLAVYAVPGPDRYSAAQKLTSSSPGPIEARAPKLLAHTLDNYVSWPDNYVHALVAAFSTGVSDVPVPPEALTGPLRALELTGATLDDVIEVALRNDRTIPASLATALMMNFAATRVRPAAVAGPIPASPFANLTHAEKGKAFQLIEQADPALVELIDANAPQPLKRGASGLLRFLGNTLLTLAPYAAYSEFGVFDRRTRRATRRPVGWDLSRYMPGRTTPADGWPEFIGYYQGRRAVENAPPPGGD